MSRGLGGLGQALAKRVKELQNIEDKNLWTLPLTSRYLLAPALSVLASLYAASSAARGFLYRHGVLWPTPLPSPVISIGNLTNGGTGKTPFVEYLACAYLQSHRFPSLILQRGRGTVDETVMLRHLFEDLPIVVSESTERASVAKEYLLANPNVRLVLLDDGLQHLPLVRDLEIVMVNALQPLGNGHLVPRGNLLEMPKAALRRADAVVLHHADLAGEERMEWLQRELASLAPRHTLFMQTAMTPLSLRSLVCNPDPMHGSLDQSVSVGMGEHVPLSALHGAAVVCLVGIGYPQTVESHLRRLGAVHIEGCGAYEDHHMFSLGEVQAAIDRMRALQPHYRHACIVMTEKDYARQHNLFDAVFRQFAAEGWAVGSEGGGAEGADEAALRWGEGWNDPPPSESSTSGSAAQQGGLWEQQRRQQQQQPEGEDSSGGGGEGWQEQTGASSSSSGGGGKGWQEEPPAPGNPCGEGQPPWGAYVLQSGLKVVEHDRRFSSQNAVLAAMLRLAVDKFRQRSYISS